MKLNIAENLRRLRRIKDMTQEELANEIGVSFQAVSKWECDDGYPDITLIPIIADFFGVSLDELCGYHEQAKETQIREIIDTYREKYEKNCLLGNEAVSYMYDAHRKFPNDDRITVRYLWTLYFHCSRDDEKYKDVKPLCEKLLSRSTDDAVRKDVYQILFESVFTEEERMAIAKRRGLSEYDYESLWWIYQKSDREKYMYYRQMDIIQKYWDLWSLIYWFHEEFDDLREQVKVIERSLMLDYAMFERIDIPRMQHRRIFMKILYADCSK